MSLLIFANSARTTLAGPISSSATTCNLAAGTGALFPNPTSGQYFIMTFNAAANALVKEIVYVTARSGDVCTIVRAQEGTTALSWLANDIAANWWTAGSAATMIQVAQLQVQAPNYAQDTGSTNSLAITLTPTPVSLTSIIGSPIRVLVAHNNTGSASLGIAGLAATLITNPDGTNLNPNQLGANHIFEFCYNGTSFDLISSPYQLLGRSNTWTQSQFFQSAVTMANNVGIYGYDTGATAREMMVYDSSNYVTSLVGTGGLWRVVNEAFTQTLLSLDNSGNLTVSGNETVGGTSYFGSSGVFYANPNGGNPVISFASGVNEVAFVNLDGMYVQSTGNVKIGAGIGTTNTYLFVEPNSVSIPVAGLYPYGGILVSPSTTSNPIQNQAPGFQILTSGQAAVYSNSTFPAFSAGVGNVSLGLYSCYYGNTLVGSITTDGTNTHYNTTSDQDLKIDEGLMTEEESGASIDGTKVHWFTWKDDPLNKPKQPGIFAQEEIQVHPWGVLPGQGKKGDEDYRPWQVNLTARIPSLLAEIQFLRKREKERDARIEALEKAAHV